MDKGIVITDDNNKCIIHFLINVTEITLVERLDDDRTQVHLKSGHSVTVDINIGKIIKALKDNDSHLNNRPNLP